MDGGTPIAGVLRNRRHIGSDIPERIKSFIPLITVAVSLCIIIAVLFLPPYVGMEDNGDYSRVMYAQGLYDLPENVDHRFDGYFIKEYGIMQYYNEYGSSVYSSLYMFLQPAIALDRLITGDDGIFDIRFLAALVTVYFLAALYFLVDLLTHRLSLPASLLIAAMCVFVFADTGYTAYFNSFFAENIAYASLLFCGTAALLYIEKRYNPYVLLGGYTLCGVILTFSKQQFAPVGIILGIMGLFIFLGSRKKLLSLFAVLASCLLAVTGVVTYLLISESFTNINMYHAMTRGVMMVSDDPAQAAEEFGIDSRYELLDGTIYFDKYPEIDPEDELLLENFYPNYNVADILMYYVKHPQTMIDLLKIAAKNAYQNRPSLGNYEKITGVEPNTIAKTFALYSSIKDLVSPRTIGYVLIWMIVTLAILYKKRGWQILVFGVMLIGLSQVFVSVLGAGDADLAKHIFMYNVAYDFINILVFANVVRFFDLKNAAKKQARRIRKMEAAVKAST